MNSSICIMPRTDAGKKLIVDLCRSADSSIDNNALNRPIIFVKSDRNHKHIGNHTAYNPTLDTDQLVSPTNHDRMEIFGLGSDPQSDSVKPKQHTNSPPADFSRYVRRDPTIPETKIGYITRNSYTNIAEQSPESLDSSADR